MGPLLLRRLLNLNDTRAGVLTLVFKIADDNGLLLLDLRTCAMVQFVGDENKRFRAVATSLPRRLAHSARTHRHRRAGATASSDRCSTSTIAPDRLMAGVS